MTRESHLEQVKRWAYFVKNNPDKWRKPHRDFINSLFINHYNVIDRLSNSPEGREKLARWKEWKRSIS